MWLVAGYYARQATDPPAAQGRAITLANGAARGIAVEMDSRFPKDYLTARERFRAAAARLGCAVEAHPIGAEGPHGEALTIDVAIVPGANPERALVVSSGIHGVEGFLGSAIQCSLLEEWVDAPPPIRCVLLHALNPFGFAWRRRVNETNVDLNRNLLLGGRAVHAAARECMPSSTAS